jgi:hypothetical protein
MGIDIYCHTNRFNGMRYVGYKHSAETRQKLSEAAKRREAKRRNSDG